MSSLVWIASYPKSGNTWMRLFLHAYMRGNLDPNAMVGPGSMGDMKEKFYDLPEGVEGQDSFWFRPAALYRISRLPGDQLLKTHCCNSPHMGMEQIPAELTKAAIYVVRDPRDVCISYAEHIGEDVDKAIEIMGRMDTFSRRDRLYQYMGSWSHHVESWCAKRPYPILVVRYEDLLANPFREFREVVRFLFGAANEDRLKAAIRMTSFDKLQKFEEEEGFREKLRQDRFFKRGKSVWRKVLSREQVERIEDAHGETMERFYDIHRDSLLRRAGDGTPLQVVP